MKKKIFHRKLIRDKIPEFIKIENNEFKTRVLGKKEFEKELKRKLLEETKETIKAPREKLLNELADVLELIKSIGNHYGLSFSKIEKYQKEKKKIRGGFKKKLFLIWSTKKSSKTPFF